MENKKYTINDISSVQEKYIEKLNFYLGFLEGMMTAKKIIIEKLSCVECKDISNIKIKILTEFLEWMDDSVYLDDLNEIKTIYNNLKDEINLKNAFKNGE